jgi:hypothetical protein
VIIRFFQRRPAGNFPPDCINHTTNSVAPQPRSEAASALRGSRIEQGDGIKKFWISY